MDTPRGRGEKLKPLSGLPFAVKDQINVAGYPTTAGNAALGKYVPSRNAAVVQRLTDAGAIVLGKTTRPDNNGRRQTDDACAIGEDTGGSVRFPAAFCGIAGLRPSTYTVDNAMGNVIAKRYSDAGIVPPSGLRETFGPMARSVADCIFLDEIITGEPTQQIALKGARIGVPPPSY